MNRWVQRLWRSTVRVGAEQSSATRESRPALRCRTALRPALRCSDSTSSLRSFSRRVFGGDRGDRQNEDVWGHPSVEVVRGPARPGRLLLASGGAYEPLEDADHDLADYLTGEPRKDAQRFVEDAVRRARALPDPYADNATALVARVA
ncbi:hypothetical protein ACF07T_40110 [Streptomyces sp. NPDC015184]|uniref:hypothetical protein n=1 Tax=Streptomyces sp. NPDC015184 TaxID=3364946 RepID=UPI0036F7DA60